MNKVFAEMLTKIHRYKFRWIFPLAAIISNIAQLSGVAAATFQQTGSVHQRETNDNVITPAQAKYP